MPGIMTIIKANGTLEKQALDKAPGLETLQAAVGGYIEAVPYFDTYLGQPCAVYCNEEGKLKGLPVNTQATRFWGYALATYEQWEGKMNDVLVGDIVVLTGDAEFLQ